MILVSPRKRRIRAHGGSVGVLGGWCVERPARRAGGGHYGLQCAVKNIMDRGFEQVIDDVLSLDRESQLLIAEKIVGNNDRTPDHASAWRQEIRRRIDEIESGTVQMRDASDVIRDARDRIRA